MYRFAILIIFLCGLTVGAGAQSKLTPYSRLLDHTRITSDTAFTYGSLTIADGVHYLNSDITLMVELEEGHSVEEILCEGVELMSHRGRMAVVAMKRSMLDEFNRLPAVKSMGFPRKTNVKLDRVRNSVNISQVHLGNAEGMELVAGGKSYTGKGVLTGILDVGVDPNHIAFLDSEGNSRVRKVLRYHSIGLPTEKATPEEIAEFTTDDTNETHGTHTSCIMAGGYRGEGKWSATGADGTVSPTTSDIPYYGMAPDADVVIGCGVMYENNIIDGVERIVAYGKEHGQRPVVNMSLGINGGALDGSDYMAAYLDEIAEEDAIIVVSAGNEGDINLSASKTFEAPDDSLVTFINHRDFSYGAKEQYYIYVYSANSEVPEVDLILYAKDESKVVKRIHASEKIAGFSSDTYNQTHYSEEFSTEFNGKAMILAGVDPANNRGCAYVDLNIARKSGSKNRYYMGLVVRSLPGNHADITTDGFVSLVSLNLPYAQEGNPSLSINPLSIGRNLISVGSYTTRTMWGKISGKPGYYFGAAYDNPIGEISGFSSYARLHDGRTMPTITAPGDAVVAAVNHFYTNRKSSGQLSGLAAVAQAGDTSYYWDGMAGTSMSAPVVSGIIATWLEADPSLTSLQVKEIFEATAIHDAFTDNAPIPHRWGAGKIDALAGLNKVLSDKASLSRLPSDISDISIIPSVGSYVISSSSSGDLSAMLFDISGRPVTSAASSTGSLSLSVDGLTPGIYIIRAHTDAGDLTEKIAIH